MGFEDSQVTFNSPNFTYFPGQTVQGRLKFDQNKIKTFRGIYVKMKGFCKVHWTSGHSQRIGNNSTLITVHHLSYETYYENKVYLVGGADGEHTLGAGHHVFPFECYIPPHCPSSFEGSYGHIRYTFKFVVDHTFKSKQEKTASIYVVAQKDLNADPYCRQPMDFEFHESYCCWCMSAGDCEVLVKLPASGFCPKQSIPIELSIANNSNVEISLITFKIREMINYQAIEQPNSRHEELTIAKLKKGPVPGNTTRNWTLEMDVPEANVYDVDGCHFINIEYEFVVDIETESCHIDSGASRRIVLGHVPLRNLAEVPPPQDEITNQPVAPLQQISAPQPRVWINPSYPSANPPLSEANPPFPGPYSPYPVVNSPYPVKNPPNPVASAPYPEENPPYPGVNLPYPVANAPYSWENTQHPGVNSPYHGENPPYPLANAPHPGVNAPYHGENPPYPAANAPYSVENLRYSEKIRPYVRENPSYYESNSPYLGSNPSYSANNPSYP